MKARIDKTRTTYQGKEVTAYQVTVVSVIPMNIDSAWKKLKTSALLEFVTKGRISFRPEGGKFPPTWEEGKAITTKMLMYGFIPFGGKHSLYFECVDDINKVMKTRESDNSAKIWNHTMSMKKIDDQTTEYKDEILIYGGMMTRFISRWAKSYYVYRHKRWQLVAEI